MSTDFQLADNGQWYEHAILGEAKRWFICFDHTDPPELVIRVMRKYLPLPRMEVYMQVEALVRYFKLPVILVRRKSNVDCLFPDNKGRWGGKLMQAFAYEVKMTGVIPISLIISFKDFFLERPTLEGVYYDGSIAV